MATELDAITVPLGGVTLFSDTNPGSYAVQNADEGIKSAAFMPMSATVNRKLNDNGEYTDGSGTGNRKFLESFLGFNIKLSTYVTNIGYTFFKNPRSPLYGKLEIKKIPSKILRIPPTMDTYIRDEFPNMNYGTDGCVVAELPKSPEDEVTQVIESLYKFEFVDENGNNVLRSIPFADILSCNFIAYNQACVSRNNIYDAKTVIGDWVENSVNWTCKPETTDEKLFELELDVSEGYCYSNDLTELLYKVEEGSDNVNAIESLDFSVVPRYEGKDGYGVTSKESAHSPYIEIEYIDREAYNATLRTNIVPFSISPKVGDSNDLGFTFNIESRNVVVCSPVTIGVNTSSFNSAIPTIRSTSEVGFDIQPSCHNIDLAPITVSINNPRLFSGVSVPDNDSIPFDLWARVYATNCTQTTFASSQTHFNSVMRPLNTDMVSFDVRPYCGSSAFPSGTFGEQRKTTISAKQTHVYGTMPSTLNTEDLAMSIWCRQSTDTMSPTTMAVSTANIFGETVNVPCYESLPFDAFVLGRSSLGFRTFVKGRYHVPFTLDAHSVSGVPFNINVLSPRITFNIDPRIRRFEGMPFEMLVRTRNASVLGFTINNGRKGNYIEIV